MTDLCDVAVLMGLIMIEDHKSHDKNSPFLFSIDTIRSWMCARHILIRLAHSVVTQSRVRLSEALESAVVHE